MKKILIIAVFLSSSILFGQSDKLNFEFDYAQFGFDSTANNVEIYYSFSQNDLSIVETDSGFLTSAVLYLQLKDSTSEDIMLDKEWRVNNIIEDTTVLSDSKSLIGVIDLIIPEGTYLAHIEGRDFNDNSVRKDYDEKITIKPFLNDTTLSMSDIELSSNIKRENINENSIFYKNTLEVIPNPTMLFAENSPVMFYYVELYNLNGNADTSNLVLQKLLYNSRGALVINEAKPVRRNQNSIVDIGIMNLRKLPTDSYSYVMNSGRYNRKLWCGFIKKILFIQSFCSGYYQLGIR